MIPRSSRRAGWVALAVAVAAALAFAVPAGAWPSGWSSPLKIRATHGVNIFDESLAVSGDGLAHAAVTQYEPEEGTPGVWYASESPDGSWTSQRLTSDSDLSPSLVVDSNGQATIAFERFPANNLNDTNGIYLASQGADGWTVQRIFHGSAHDPSLRRFDGHDYIAFAGPGRTVYYGTNASGSWHFEHFGTQCCTGSPLLRVAPDGTPRIAWIAEYPDDTPRNVKYSSWEAGVWHTVKLGPTLGHLAFDLAGDRPYVAFNDGGPVVRSIKGGQWTKSTLGPSDYLPWDLVANGHGTIYVLLMSQSRLRLVTMSTSAVASQLLTKYREGYTFDAHMALHAGKLAVLFASNAPNTQRGIWFTRQD